MTLLYHLIDLYTKIRNYKPASICKTLFNYLILHDQKLKYICIYTSCRSSTGTTSTRIYQKGEPADGLLQGSQHLSLLGQDCIMTLNKGLHL